MVLALKLLLKMTNVLCTKKIPVDKLDLLNL